jgi:CubicO group peptidase (beta-lactamase class C family)
MSSIITDRIHAAAVPHVGPGGVPGLIALALRGEDESLVALGNLDVEPGRPARRDSLFRITSTTKPITAAETLALVGEGLISLEEPVDRLLPELAGRRVLRRPDGPLEDTVPAVRAITTRDLLTFTFGFGMVLEMFTAPEPWPVVAAEQQLGLATLGPPDPSVPPDPDTWISRLGSMPLLAQPGERWMYNTGAAVLGVLLSRAARAPLGEVLRTRLFDPLGMRDTGFWTDQTGRLATAYRPSQDGLLSCDPPAGGWSRPPAFPDAAAGLVSTVDDLAAFARMLVVGGRGPSGVPVLSPELVRAMTSDQLTPAQKDRGGLGHGFFDGRSWGFCQAVYDSGAYGWDGGFGTSWLVDPARELVVIVLTQRMFESPATPQLHRDIQAAAYAAI